MDLILPLTDLQNEVIKGCIADDRRCQKKLYEHYYSSMLMVCRRYAQDNDEAVGMLNEGFVKVFKNLKKYRSNSSLEAWIKRIMINNAIDHYRKTKKHKYALEIETVYDLQHQENIHSNLCAKQLLELVRKLPPAYQTVFNLFAIEGWTHREIAEKLNISEGTSKSNLSKARKKLQKMLQQLNGNDGH